MGLGGFVVIKEYEFKSLEKEWNAKFPNGKLIHAFHELRKDRKIMKIY